jgi:predicted nucleic acid-binding protein
MAGYFVDSNVFLRFYTADDQKQQAEAQEIFMKAKAGEVDLFCGPPVFFEIAWVLRSRYKVPLAETLDKLESILTIPNLHVSDEDCVKRAISLARESNQSYPDAYIAVVAQDRNIGVATFNAAHFAKLGAKMYHNVYEKRRERICRHKRICITTWSGAYSTVIGASGWDTRDSRSIYGMEPQQQIDVARNTRGESYSGNYMWLPSPVQG